MRKLLTLRTPALAVLIAVATPPLAGQTVFVRRDVTTLTTAQIAALRRGVAVMKSRPVTDPTSWQYQANIHGTNTTPVRPAWNTCQHGSYLFLSWHRMYLHFLERILRRASGDPNFALPYWNYSCPCARSLPAIFRTPADATNSLFVSNRGPGVNTGGQLPVSAVASLVSLIPTNFSSPAGSGASFGGQRVSGAVHFGSPHGRLESQPHDVVHVTLGGLMSDPNTAAQDPIFYLHHANIDRLWNRWLQLGGGRVNPATTDAAWSTTPFTFFDENGTAVTMTGQQVVNAAAQLGYRYDDESGPVSSPIPVIAFAAAPAPPEVVAASAAATTPMELGLKPMKVAVPIAEPSRPKLAAAAAAPEKTQIVLTVEGIEYDSSPGVFYEIYLNLPAGTTEPDPQGTHYVGNLALFALKPHHGDAPPEGVRQTYDVTAVVQELKKAGKWNDDNVDVTFFPRGMKQPAGAAAAAKVQKTAQDAKARFAKVTISTEGAQ